MTLHYIPLQPDPASVAFRAFSRHATDCLDTTLHLATMNAQRADMAWLLSRSLDDLEQSIRAVRSVLEPMKWNEVAA